VPRRPTRTFLDSGVLIAAFRGQPQIGEPAAKVLEDSSRLFLSSPFVHLELCPKSLFNRRQEEHAFYQRYFERAEMARNLTILTLAATEASHSGVSPMDSLHIAAAHLLRADEFITTEKPNKSSLVTAVYLFD
jgi:predicted nucleic acid-binding protein